MKSQISIPKELLAQFDLSNTLTGGVAQASVRAWQEHEGYHLVLRMPGIALDKIRIEAVQQRFVIYYMVKALGGSVEMPYYLVNLPLLPIVDVNRIEARIEEGKIHVFAPFSDWAKGSRKEIALEE